MNRIITTGLVLGLVSSMAACGSDDAPAPSSTATPAATQSTAPAKSTAPQTAGVTASTSTQAAGSAAVSGVPTGQPIAGMSVSETGGAPATPVAGSDTSEASADAGATPAKQAVALPLDPTNVDVTQNIKRRFGAPHVAVNPKDSNNIVVLASSNLGYTRDCVPPPPGSDCEQIPAGGNPLLTQPRGFAKTPGFMDIGVYVSFDRGQTFSQVNIDDLVPPGHPEVRARGEGPIAAMPDGSFFIGFNAINWGNWESQPMTFFPNGGVGVIKSTDGGKSWSWSSYSYTPADWPYGGADPITGTFYVTSGLVGLSTLGPRSNGMPDSPEGDIADRWIASTQDGMTWTDPQPLGGTNGGSHVGAGHSPAAAAHGILATLFLANDASACRLFVESSSPCVVFQTSTDAGANWNRHRVPTPAGFTPAALSVLVGADPTQKEHFTVALLADSGSEFLVYQTPDSGNTWSEAVHVGEDASKTHFAPFVAYSPDGTFGLMWRTYERDPQKPFASAPTMPYSVWAAISKDGGLTFSQPLKISKADSPAPPDDPDDAFSFVGDHGPSGMAMDGDGGVYVVWADWTPGERAIFFSAVDARAFSY